MTGRRRQESDPDGNWAERALAGMSLEQKVAQVLLVLPSATADGRPDSDTLAAVAAGVGVLHGLRRMPPSQVAAYHLAVHDHAVASGLPAPLITSNLECGVGYSLRSGGTQFPYPLGLGWADDEDAAFRMAVLLADEARALGYHWILGPCIDVLAVPDDPIIGIRSYGSDPGVVGRLGASQIRGFQHGGLLACAKHFPGHGDSRTDSHRDLPVVARTLEQHRAVHLPPFRQAVAAGVGSVMTAHLIAPELGITRPASVDPEAHRQLRQELGFDGIVITDDLLMGALARDLGPAEAAIASLQAGADLANVKDAPGRLPAVVDTISEAVRAGELSERRLDQSVLRLLRVRVQLGLDHDHGIDLARAELLDRTRSWEDPSLPAMVEVTDHGSRLPLQVAAGSTVRLVVPAGDRADELAPVIRRWTGAEVRTERLDGGPIPDRSDGLTVLALTPPSPGTLDDLPSATELAQVDLLITLRPTPATRPMETVPTVCAPAIDAFDVLSSAALEGAVRRSLQPR